MPTIITHAAVPLALWCASERGRLSPRLLAAGIVAAMLPDADVLAFALHVPYADAFGHRGASHSLLYAGLIALLGVLRIACCVRTRCRQQRSCASAPHRIRCWMR